MRRAGASWNTWRAFIGLFYLAAAIFNAAYTLPRANRADFFEGYADGAWFGFLEDFMWDVFTPNAVLFMSLIIAFEVAVFLLLFARGAAVTAGAVLSVVWVVGILPFIAWPYLVVNVVLAAMQAAVLLRRYDTTIWSMARGAFEHHGTPLPR